MGACAPAPVRAGRCRTSRTPWAPDDACPPGCGAAVRGVAGCGALWGAGRCGAGLLRPAAGCGTFHCTYGGGCAPGAEHGDGAAGVRCPAGRVASLVRLLPPGPCVASGCACAVPVARPGITGVRTAPGSRRQHGATRHHMAPLGTAWRRTVPSGAISCREKWANTHGATIVQLSFSTFPQVRGTGADGVYRNGATRTCSMAP